METFESLVDFKKFEQKTVFRLALIVAFTITTGYFNRELRPNYGGKTNTTPRYHTLLIAVVIDIAAIAFFLNLKNVKTININTDKSIISVDFQKCFQKPKFKTAYLKKLRFKTENKKGHHYLTLSDNDNFYFKITEEEYDKSKQLEIANYLKSINCRPLS